MWYFGADSKSELRNVAGFWGWNLSAENHELQINNRWFLFCGFASTSIISWSFNSSGHVWAGLTRIGTKTALKETDYFILAERQTQVQRLYLSFNYIVTYTSNQSLCPKIFTAASRMISMKYKQCWRFELRIKASMMIVSGRGYPEWLR